MELAGVWESARLAEGHTKGLALIQAAAVPGKIIESSGDAIFARGRGVPLYIQIGPDNRRARGYGDVGQFKIDYFGLDR